MEDRAGGENAVPTASGSDSCIPEPACCSPAETKPGWPWLASAVSYWLRPDLNLLRRFSVTWGLWDGPQASVEHVRTTETGCT